MTSVAHSLADLLGAPSRVVEVERGDCLFRRGDRAHAVFAVASGRLRLERCLEDGTTVGLAVLSAGSGVAEAALFSEVYHCDARAEVRSRLWAYPKAEALDTLRREPRAFARLAQMFSGEVRRLRALLEIRAVKRADERVLAYLDLLGAFGERWSDERPLSAAATDLGLTPEALYRALRHLETDGRIGREGKRVWKT